MAKYDAVKKQWGSIVNDKSSVVPKLRLFDSLSTYASKVAQINADTGKQITFGELQLQTIRAAQNLQKLGIQPRQMFGFMVTRCDELLSIYLASVCMVCPILPLYRSLSTQVIANILRKIRPVVMFCDADGYHYIKGILCELDWEMKLFTFDGSIDGTEPVSNLLCETGDEENFVVTEMYNETDIAGIFHSSGTTGPSKGVIRHFSTIFSELKKYPEDCIVLDDHPIFWTVGLTLLLRSVYSGSTRILTAKPLSAQNLLELIEKYKINMFNPNSGEMVACLKHARTQKFNLSRVEYICTFGGKLSKNLVADVKRYFPNAYVIEPYGMTEIGAISNSFVIFPGENDIFDNGHRLFANRIVKIVDENGARCGPNKRGEIRVKMAHKFEGYSKDPTQTANAVDDEGFFRTGDWGYFNDDGLLFIGGRIKDTFKAYYFTTPVYPNEIEESLTKLPDIKDVCIVGIPIKHEFHLPAAVAVRMPNSKLSQRDVFNMVADTHSDQVKPRGGVYFVDELPRNQNGKLLRREIAKLAMEQFKAALANDNELQFYLADIPEDFRATIYKCVNEDS